ncbi:hypothetical protein K438DRAFT_1961490 [Mycena galopus ATCC 62051]|nr:hypothetical protein K438DRAFT_1961490 [Mycena galopus ATCC 62051]
MRAIDGFTGNGGGDADSDDPTAILKDKLSVDWEKEGWRELFDLQFGTSAKALREIVRNSAKPISDNEAGNSGDDSDVNIHPDLRKPAPCVPKTPAATQVSNSFSNLGELMKIRLVAEEKKASAYDAKVTLEREKFKTKGKVDMTHKIPSTPGTSDQVKNTVNAYLLTLLASLKL